MNRKFDKINEALDIETEVINVDAKEIKRTVTAAVKEMVDSDRPSRDLLSDYKYSRTNNYELSSTINDVIYEMFEIAKNTQKARDFEVVGQLIKIAKEIDDGYLDRHQKIKKIEENTDAKKESKITNQTTNTVFVGSTAELQKFLKENSKK